MSRVVLVQNTSFNSEKNRRILQGAGGHYIIGEKMRLDPNEIPVGRDSEARRHFVVIKKPVAICFGQ